VPIANGGEHNYRNVQTAHLICNGRKSNNENGQPLLIGRW